MKPVYIKIDEYGNKFYYSDKKMMCLHRTDGPAYEGADGTKTWWVNGHRHREDGPAYECASGTKSWYLDGVEVSEAEHARRTAKETVLTLDEIAAKFGVDVSTLKIKK